VPDTRTHLSDYTAARPASQIDQEIGLLWLLRRLWPTFFRPPGMSATFRYILHIISVFYVVSTKFKVESEK
jgi:hypothetical protein